jgi:hypothetical protein
MKIIVNILGIGFILLALTFHVQTIRADRYMQTAIRKNNAPPLRPRHWHHRAYKHRQHGGSFDYDD